MNISIPYLISSGDPDQCVHLVQSAAVFLPGHTAQTDCVCVLVGEKFHIAPHRHFLESSDTRGTTQGCELQF